MALQAMGYDGLVPRCERGLPVWPGGLLGSISHTAEYAWAAVVRKQQVAGVGVDCEGLLATAVASELWQLVGTAGERDLLSGAFGFTEAVTILFSAKEAIYKCLNPVTGWALDFSDVKLVGFAGGSLQAEVSAERFADLQTLQLDIEFCFLGNHFFSLCLLPVDSPVAENAFVDPAISGERMPT